MNKLNQKSSTTNKKRSKITLAMVMLAAVAAIWWQHIDRPVKSSANTKAQPELPAATTEKYDVQTTVHGLTPADKKVAAAQKKALAQLTAAARSVPAAKPLNGPITRRPKFVAEFEWNVIQQVAGQNPDAKKKQTELVNKLLFFKKWEAWRNLLGDDRRTTARHGLAKEILAMIPAQMEILGPEQVWEMKDKLLEDLNGKS